MGGVKRSVVFYETHLGVAFLNKVKNAGLARYRCGHCWMARQKG
ncbi:hypothetical protein RV01_GL001804 [Enterococcus dispar]|nr:hypothetical protein RV01_GL001804 [Enterococcus dispar]